MLKCTVLKLQPPDTVGDVPNYLAYPGISSMLRMECLMSGTGEHLIQALVEIAIHIVVFMAVKEYLT